MHFGNRFSTLGEPDEGEERMSSPLLHANPLYAFNSADGILLGTTVERSDTSSSAPSHEALSAGSSPVPAVLEGGEGAVAVISNGASSSLSLPSIPVCTLGYRAGGNREECALETTDCNDARNRSQSPSAGNPLRSMNPAFSLSPRTASSSCILQDSQNSPNITIHMDKEEPQVTREFSVGTVEGRRNFVLECIHLAERMSTWSIIKELVPALLLVASYEDSACAIACLLPAVVKRIEDLNEDVFVYFMGLIMNMCCAVDHEVLRQISASLKEIMLYVNDTISELLLLPLVMSMRVSFWSSPRAVAAALLGVFASRPNLVEASGMTVMDWFNSYVKLVKDKSHFVREVAFSSLHQWVYVSEVYHVNLAEMPLRVVHKCMVEEQSDTVRFVQVAELLRLAEKIGKEATVEHLQKSFIAASKDASWRVRYVVAKNLGAFALLSLHPGDLLEVFLALCADDMKETRAIAVEQLQFFTPHNVSHEVLCTMCLAAASLAKDKNPVVRESVAKLLHTLLSPVVIQVYTPNRHQALFALLTDEEYVVGCNATRNLERVVSHLNKYLRPAVGTKTSSAASSASGPVASAAIAAACKDRKKHCGVHWHDSHSDEPSAEESTNPLASIKAAKKQKTATNLLSSSTISETVKASPERTPTTTTTTTEGMTTIDDECMENKHRDRAAEILSGVIDHLHVISESRNWRIREAVVDVLRHFCVALTEEEFIPLTYIIRSLLRDPVSVVRTRAIETFSVVARWYGAEWAAVMAFDLLRKEFSMGAGTSFTWRVVAIYCLSGILPVVCGLSPMDLRRQELMQQWMRLVTAFSGDGVSNVRLALAKSIAMHWEWYCSCRSQKDVICQCVEQLQRDVDVDVSYAVSKLDFTTMDGDREPF